MKERRKLTDNYFGKQFSDYINGPYLKVKNKNLIYPLGESPLHFPGMDKGYGLRVKLGRFFEFLAQGIYGGEIGKHREFNDSNGKNIRTEPDIIHQKKNILREVKANQTGSRLRLSNEQMSKYLSLQIENCHLKSPVIRFEIFRYNVRGLSKIFNENGLGGLVNELAKGTRAMISFPFNVMYKIYKGDNPFIQRYESAFADSTDFRSSGLYRLLIEPEKTFEEMDINPEFFEFKKKRFPEDIKINKIQIKSFPVLIINEKDPKAELEKLKEFVEYEEVPF